jgi:hypothetical protein
VLAASPKKKEKRSVNESRTEKDNRKTMKKRVQIYILFLLTMFCNTELMAQFNFDQTLKTNNYNQPQINSGVDQSLRNRQRGMEEFNRTINRNNTKKRTYHFDLPEPDPKTTVAYRKTANLLFSMLNGTKPANLKDAVFAVENAYFNGKLEYSKYNKAIQNLITIAKLKAAQDGYNWSDPLTRNMMIFRVMADTMKIKFPGQEAPITSYPMRYDFNDPKGDENSTKQFVSKLLSTHSGQCHSLPLLYLILAEETNTPAQLSLAPSHMFVKIKDKSGTYYNLELTNGRITSDAFILGSGYVTSEALKNHLYMEPLTKKQTIAMTLNDLTSNYLDNIGYTTFALQCNDSVMKFDPNNFQALSIRSNYYTAHFKYVIDQIQRPPLEQMQTNYPKVYRLYQMRNKIYDRIDQTGYRKMPKEVYQQWLKSAEKEKRDQEERLNKMLLIHITK